MQHDPTPNQDFENIASPDQLVAEPSDAESAGQDDLRGWGDTTCSHCGYTYASVNRTWCPQCGYIAHLSTFVDLDEYDREDAGAAISPAETEELVWWRQVPVWVWVILGGVVALSFLSLLAVLATSAESAVRTRWSLGQVLIGVIALLTAHAVSFYRANLETDSLALTDIVLKPLVIWGKTIRELPASYKQCASGVWGLTAIFLAVTVIGGIPYEKFWDWGFKEPVKQDLMAAIIEQAKENAGKKSGGDDEDLIGGLKDLDGDGIPDPAALLDLLPTNKLECLVVGYMTDGEDEPKVERLILASLVNNEFRCVGALLANKFPPDVTEHLLERLPELVRAKPFVKNDYHSATWVEPKVVLRILYKKWDQRDRVEGAELEELLAELP